MPSHQFAQAQPAALGCWLCCSRELPPQYSSIEVHVIAEHGAASEVPPYFSRDIGKNGRFGELAAIEPVKMRCLAGDRSLGPHQCLVQMHIGPHDRDLDQLCLLAEISGLGIEGNPIAPCNDPPQGGHGISFPQGFSHGKMI